MASRFIPFHPASSDGGRQDTGALPWCEAAESGMRILPMLSENEKKHSNIKKNVFKSVNCIQNIQKYTNIFKHIQTC